MPPITFSWVWLLAATVAARPASIPVVAGSLTLHLGVPPLRPDVDPFYSPAAGWEATAPGTVLRNRTVVASLATLLPVPLQAIQLLYRTTDALGAPMHTVTTILIPPNAQRDKLVAYGVPEDATALSCAPSYNIQLGSSLLDLDATFLADQLVALPAVLSQGLIMTLPDYEGPNSAFGAGRLAGQAVLDSIRATLSYGPEIGLGQNTSSVMYGYSGGAIAVGWAASLKDTYAPELNIVGASQGGTPADLQAVALTVNTGFGSGLLLSALIGLTRAYPALNASFGQLATPKLKALVTTNGPLCAIDIPATFVDLLGGEDYVSCGVSIFEVPVWKSVINEISLGRNASLTPRMPLHVVHAKGDELIPWAQAATMVASYCAEGNGANVQFVTDNSPLAEHITEEIFSTPGAVKFLVDRLAGVPFPSGCSYENRGLI